MMKFNWLLMRLFSAIIVLLLGSIAVDGKSNTGKKGSPVSYPASVPSDPIVGSLVNGREMTEPCLMFESDRETGGRASWYCQLFGEDAKNAGAKDGHSASVRIVGLDKPPGSKWISGSTTLLSKDASIDKKYLLIPESASIKFGTKNANGVHAFVDTVDTIKKTIVVRVKATQSESTPSVDQLRSDIFGDEDDEYNFKTQMEGCSFNRVKVEKATGSNINDGVVEVSVDTTDDEVADYEKMESKVKDALETLFNTDDLSTAADLIMICQPPVTSFDGFSAYAYFNSPLSFYWDYYCTYPDLGMHEVGHNLYLGHSAQLGSTYGDGSGIMGGSVHEDEGDKTLRCFNSPKMWQLGWFAENSHNLDLVSNDWEGKLVGTANFQASNDAEKNVLLKIAESYYIQFNYAAGFHTGSKEFINRVTITKQYGDGEYSWIQAALREGEAYTIDIFGFGPITVEVVEIDTSSFENAYAHVHVYKGARARCIEQCCFDMNCGNDGSIFARTDKSFYNPGDTIEVTFANNAPKKYDWIWLIEDADINRFGEPSKEWNDEELWLYICGSKDCEETPTSGVLFLDSSNLQEGVYRAYYLWIDKESVAFASSEFTVLGDGNTLPPTMAPVPDFHDTILSDKLSYSDDGEAIEITFKNTNPTHYDWIGIYSAEEEVQKYAKISDEVWLWTYACGSKDCADDGNAVYDGTVSFSTESLEIGTYRAYLLFGDQYSVITRSEESTVGPSGPISPTYAPTKSPTSTPTTAPTTPCEDDVSWKWFKKPDLGCSWVANKPRNRCKGNKRDIFGRKSKDACPIACNTCDTYQQPPLEYVGEDHNIGDLQLCQGNCDDDSECGLGLICYDRDDDEPVPQCSGNPMSEKYYCNVPPPETLVTRARKGTTSPAFPLGLCEGHCESHHDCKFGLKCQTRYGWETDALHGCDGWGAYGDSYCVLNIRWYCQDDPTWKFKNKRKLNCDWVSKNPEKHCKKKENGSNGRFASEGCPNACNTHGCADNDHPPGLPLVYVGTGEITLEECEGHCNIDSDCAGNLICHQRNEGESVVPRCVGDANTIGESFSENYCIRPPSESETRIIAIGDVHGDIVAVKNALQLAGVIDDNGSWVGGETQVVQLGDQLDRGDTERQILDLFVKLEVDAINEGGGFHPLNGNHELMNVELDLGDVSDGGFAEFSNVTYSPDDDEIMSYPEEQRGRVAAFRPGGEYAKILAERPVIYMLNNNLFVHGGVLPGHLDYGIDKINTEVSEWMKGVGEEPDTGYIGDDEHPVWSRHYSDYPDASDCEILEEVLTRTGTDRMIVSHTVQWDEGINSDCAGKVWRVDVGLSSAYGDSVPAQILEIIGDYIRVIL